MPKFELHKVGFVNPSTETENVVLSTILEGADAATRAFVEEEPEAYVTEDNQEVKDGQIFTFQMAGNPTSTDFAQLVSWADDAQKVTISGFAYGEALLIENAYLTFLPNTNERRVWGISARKAAPMGYDDNGKLDVEFMMSRNLLNMYYWQEGATTGLAAGWAKTGGTTAWDGVNNEQDFSTTGATDVYIYRDIYFPFEKELTFFTTVDAVTSTTGLTIGIVAYDEDGATIGSESTSAITTTGTSSVTRTLPSGTVRVRCRIKVGQDDSISFSNPGLSIGTSTTYISQ